MVILLKCYKFTKEQTPVPSCVTDCDKWTDDNAEKINENVKDWY